MAICAEFYNQKIFHPANYRAGFQMYPLNSCIRRQLLPADISQLLRAVIICRYRLSATSVRILDIIKMSG